MKKVYNKLVRDKIPEIIVADNQSCVTEILSEGEYIKQLDKKLNEEVAEYQDDKGIYELVGILEVIYSIAKVKGTSQERLESLRKEKAEKRGGFSKRIFLKEIET